jgi:hypothetical protein
MARQLSGLVLWGVKGCYLLQVLTEKMPIQEQLAVRDSRRIQNRGRLPLERVLATLKSMHEQSAGSRDEFEAKFVQIL